MEGCQSVVDALCSAIDGVIVRKYVQRILSDYQIVKERIHTRKLSNPGINNDIAPCDPDKVVFNFSRVTLSGRTKTLLAYGLDFCLPVYKLDYYTYFLSLECLVSRLRFLGLDRQSNFSDFLLQFHSSSSLKVYYGFNPFKIFSAVFSKRDMEDLKKLGANQDIVVCEPDKGGGMVILDKIPYIDKMLLLISDRSKFEPINESIQKFTLKIEDKVNYFLRKLKNSDTISAETCGKLLASGSSPGIL